MAVTYGEGTVFSVPLRAGGYAVGVIARVSANDSGGLLGYFFGPKTMSLPPKDIVGSLSPPKAIRVLRFGDLSLLNGAWPIIGTVVNWNRKDWPMPYFVRRDDLSQKAWRVRYAEENISEVVEERPEPFDSPLEKDAAFGAGAVELLLTRLLA